MVSGIEGVGEAVTGSMLARAVEPETGEDGHTRETRCLNCGAALAGPYCHQCGQKGHVRRTLTAFWHDLAHGVLHFEGKIWRTLPLLAWRPGELTRRYVEGERARFVSPMALFLFSVFLMFAVFSMVGVPINFNSSRAQQELVREAVKTERQAQTLERERGAAVAAGRPTRDIDRRLAAARQESRLIRTMADRGVVQGGAVRMSDDLPASLGWLDQGYRKAKENPSLLLYKLQANAYKFSWALIPISVPFVWLMFLHRRRYWRFKAYDHTVFVTYSIAFMTLLLVALAFGAAIGLPDGAVALALTFVPPIHMYRQLKGAYGLSRFGALWRTLFLMISALFASILFFLLLLTLGLLG